MKLVRETVLTAVGSIDLSPLVTMHITNYFMDNDYLPTAESLVVTPIRHHLLILFHVKNDLISTGPSKSSRAFMN